MLIKEELPVTEFSLIQYINYSGKQIEESKSLIRKLKNRIKIGIEKLEHINPKEAKKLAEQYKK